VEAGEALLMAKMQRLNGQKHCALLGLLDWGRHSVRWVAVREAAEELILREERAQRVVEGELKVDWARLREVEEARGLKACVRSVEAVSCLEGAAWVLMRCRPSSVMLSVDSL